MNWKVIWFLLSFVILMNTGFGNKSLTHFNNGKRYFKQGQNDKAINSFSKAIEINSNYSDAYTNRCVAYGKKGSYDQAISDCNRAIELNSEDDIAYNNRGKIYARIDEHDKALVDLNKAIEINPKQYLAYMNLGELYNYEGKNDLAIKSISRAIEIRPEYLHGYLMRGIIYNVEKGECGKAISDFSKVIELAPRYAPAYNAKSWILATSPETKCRDGAEAVQLAKKSSQLKRNAISLSHLAASYAESGDFKNAVAIQEEAVALLLKEESRANKDMAVYKERLRFYQVHKPWRNTQ